MSKRIGPEMFEDVSDKTQAEIENEMAEKAPGGIPIITGGMQAGALPWQGADVMVVITDTLQPNSREFLPISIASPAGTLSRRVRFNTPSLLPMALVRHLEGNLLERVDREISPDSPMYGNRQLAENTNPTMIYEERGDRAFLTRTSMRYIVRRVSPQEMRA